MVSRTLLTLKMSGRIRGLLSLLVAAIAVLLSQFPPVYQWFEAANMQVKVSHSFVISSGLFRAPSITKHFSVTNVGKAPGRIISLHLFITNRNEEILYESSAQAYRLRILGQFERQKWEEFSELSLHSDRTWSHLVSFGRQLSNAEIEDIQAIQFEVEEEREEWRHVMEEKGYDVDSIDYTGPTFDLPDTLSNNLSEAVKERIPWLQEGRYRLYEICATANGTKAMGYDFKIHKRQVRQFSRSLDRLLHDIDYGNLPNVRFRMQPSTATIPKAIEERILQLEISSYY